MIDELIHLRTSVRDFRDQKIKTNIISDILDVGRFSASGNNEQPWMFGAVTDPKLIENISDAAYGQKFIKSAPLLIIMCTKISDDFSVLKAQFPSLNSVIDETNKDLLEKVYAKENQTKIPGTQMILRALEEGIGACWVSYFNAELIAELINLPSDFIVSELIVFGYPKESLKPRRKKDLAEIVFYNSCK